MHPLNFYLGTHEENWLSHPGPPLFISRRRLFRRPRKVLPRACRPWAMDSGGFTELNLYGWWQTPAMQYITEVRRAAQECVGMRWAAIQDWMCEPFVLARTGLSVYQHQRMTVQSYRLLRQLAPDLPWCPVIQGFTLAEYVRCVQMYGDAGTNLTSLPVVGLGSICRRQATSEAEDMIRALHELGIKLHGFGFKLKGLARVGHLLHSADSMAWSFAARYGKPLPSCTHPRCNNCAVYANRWHAEAVSMVPTRRVTP
jgi:hypothetical protein